MRAFDSSPDIDRDAIDVMDFRCVGSGDFELCVDAVLDDGEQAFWSD